MSPARVKLDRCDILTLKADVCICGIHRSRNLQMFALSKRFLRKSGQTVQDELYKGSSDTKDLAMGDVEMTGPGRLKNFKKLLFICLQSYKDGNEEYLLQSLLECLEIAAVEGLNSVAVPALGTGGLKYPPQKVASATINAVNLHNEQFKESSIQTVNIILFDDDKELIKTYLQMCISGSTNLTATESDSGGRGHGTATGLSADSGGASSTAQLPRAGSQPVANSSKSQQTGSIWSSLTTALLKLGFTYQVGVLQFRVSPSFDGKYAGLNVTAGVDVSFLKSFIPTD